MIGKSQQVRILRISGLQEVQILDEFSSLFRNGKNPSYGFLPLRKAPGKPEPLRIPKSLFCGITEIQILRHKGECFCRFPHRVWHRILQDLPGCKRSLLQQLLHTPGDFFPGKDCPIRYANRVSFRNPNSFRIKPDRVRLSLDEKSFSSQIFLPKKGCLLFSGSVPHHTKYKTLQAVLPVASHAQHRIHHGLRQRKSRGCGFLCLRRCLRFY